MYEPGFHSSVIQDRGSSLIAAVMLGPWRQHSPNVNIEMGVARLIHSRELGDFHSNEAKSGDDDLDAGSIE
jgi:L-rhamnose isomerase / sugar isomerase